MTRARLSNVLKTLAAALSAPVSNSNSDANPAVPLYLGLDGGVATLLSAPLAKAPGALQAPLVPASQGASSHINPQALHDQAEKARDWVARNLGKRALKTEPLPVPQVIELDPVQGMREFWEAYAGTPDVWFPEDDTAFFSVPVSH